MYKYEFDAETGGLLLTDVEEKMSKEPRPVYAEEMNILGFNQHMHYRTRSDVPYLWAESGNYFYRGKKIAVVKGGTFCEKPTVEILFDNLPKNLRLRPINLKKMIKKNYELMENLRQATVKRIYNYWRRWHKKLDGFHVAFSGGKDSIVLLDLVKHSLSRSAYVVMFADTRMEFPDTYDLVAEVEAQCHAEGIEFYRATSEMLPEETWKIFGAPSNVLRWCCSVHKSAPQTLKLRKIFKKEDFVGADFVGVRAQESIRRSEYEVENYGMKQRGQYSHNSILEWSSAEIWLYIFMYNLPINAAYKKGHSRVGCLLCPMSNGRANFFRINSYPDEVRRFEDYLRDNVVDEDFDSYLNNGGWINRRNGRDLKSRLTTYEETIVDDYLMIKVENPRTDWSEWIKTIGDCDFPYEIKKESDRIFFKIRTAYTKTSSMKIFKSVFHKSAACVGCGVCESNCKFGAISFKGGFHIDNRKCTHCLQCHNISAGCLVFDSCKPPGKGDLSKMKNKSLNTFSDHAPRVKWLKDFFSDPNSFLKENTLGVMQKTRFKRFLYDAELLDRQSRGVTELTDLAKKIGWNNESVWGLILVNLTFNNPQMRWYVYNLPLNEGVDRDVVEEKLQALKVSVKDSISIVKAFRKLCEIPLGTELNFGSTARYDNRQFSSLKRNKVKVDDGRVILYSLYKFAESAGGWYQFNLTNLIEYSDEASISPTKIFGLERKEFEQFLNGLSVNYPDFINVTFTHDLEKISLSEEKSSRDVLTLFVR